MHIQTRLEVCARIHGMRTKCNIAVCIGIRSRVIGSHPQNTFIEIIRSNVVLPDEVRNEMNEWTKTVIRTCVPVQ
jgi:hypothetical protein